jgi:hypothetical protein
MMARIMRVSVGADAVEGWVIRFVFVVGLAVGACHKRPAAWGPTAAESASAQACAACITQGGTWQPEANECTVGCAIMDISCYTDACPAACSDDCGGCFGETECKRAGCSWHQEQEAMWCTDKPGDRP